jgi:succinylglutamate desuccinylase
MIEEIIELQGQNPGPISIILIGVHGDERCGLDAVNNLLPNLKIEINKGTVFIIQGNPKALEQNVRFTETNLNRMFKPDEQISELDKQSYEYNRAQFLKTYLNRAGVLLDIHASYVPYSKPFIICENNGYDIASYLPVDLIVSGFDLVEPGGTDYYMNSIGKVGICVECGYLGDEYSTTIAEKSILSFLQIRGHVEQIEMIKTDQSYIEIDDLYYSKTNSFNLTKDFKDFDELHPEQLIGVDGGEEIRAKKDSVILFARNVNESGEEAFLLGEYKKRVR